TRANACDTKWLLLVSRGNSFPGIPRIGDFASIRDHFQWSEEQNMYRPGMSYLARGNFIRSQSPREIVASISRWQELWRIAESGSKELAFDVVEGKVRPKDNNRQAPSGGIQAPVDWFEVGPR
ncbi:MAG: hypothetical protein AAF958_13600, partial [Planctomycetota bacterium]